MSDLSKDPHFRAGYYEARAKYFRRTLERVAEAETIERAQRIAKFALESTPGTLEEE